MRRFTRLTNAFSKKFANHCHMVALYATWYNFIKQHKTLKGITPAMAAGVSDKMWSMEDVVALIDARAAKPNRPGTYRKRSGAERSMKPLPLALALVGLSTGTMAADPGCKTNPELTGQCYMLTGIALLSADIGIVLSPDENRELRPGERIIVRAAPGSDQDMPDSVARNISDDLTAQVHGTYEVCPIPVQPSQFPPEMTKFVCINAAAKITVIRSPFSK